ncbi:methionyl-tRNA formyltransferase [Desulfolucanica intricata]|uniref:methionyl-tRNA formyltransferase n=1 Tax=Desulfolucanica intricata TaxID=1285191 RepID=UPI000830915A|nr:methionyl-tRNA formyltransferase [Desulfolucanica intricata]
MRIVFMGTPDFAVPTLKKIIADGHRVTGVVTQPDRPKGRGKKILAPPVKMFAQEAGLKVYQPEKIKTLEITDILKELAPQVIVVVAYGQILSPEILSIPPEGCINVHASLLPRYRGAAPIHWAIINGEKETGITTMFMNEGLDTGDMILRRVLPINDKDNVGVIHDRLAVLGAEVLGETLKLVEKGSVPREAQQNSEATYAPILTREHEIITWDKDARAICNLIRGMDPWPGARTYLDGEVIKIWRARPDDTSEKTACRPGQILKATPAEGIVVQTGKGLVCIEELQRQGSRRMQAADFLRGRQLLVEKVFGEQ